MESKFQDDLEARAQRAEAAEAELLRAKAEAFDWMVANYSFVRPEFKGAGYVALTPGKIAGRGATPLLDAMKREGDE